MLDSGKTLEMITEVIQGLVACILVGTLSGIAIIDAVTGRSFSEPVTVSALAGAAVGFYYGQRNQRRQQETISDLSTKIVNGK